MPTAIATNFADEADLRAFKRCKALGYSDLVCFRTGDNGVGKWGHNTAQNHTPMCALPREVWQRAGKKGGAKVSVTYRGRTVRGILGDTMPSLSNIKNSAGIDLNPAFCRLLGIKTPARVRVEWNWS